MTNERILEIAMGQSAIDANCQPGDFCTSENKIVISANHANARKYLELPFYCDLVSYGNNIVASVNEDIAEFVKEYINKYPVINCFETPNLHILNDELQKRGMRICFMAEYFLPDLSALKVMDCGYEIKILEPEEFKELYTSQWSNALCEKRKHLDVLAAGAYDDGRLVGLAGCSADCETMWQVGIDILPEYRRKGIATALTSRMAFEALGRGKVPFYCAAWSNIKSVRNAIKSGFRPAWVEVTAKSADFVTGLNQKTFA
ncbi:GNAT family N-acetyltransferase [Lacrimispora indolis]|uniref:GNAT family N-acetyltransferase n=1 Tax=Lacrimispora indolis TaxID=69825 RepID=UPI00045EC4A1|nr:GNAT family N-acetyltransferase [Lacrimispora indolis]